MEIRENVSLAEFTTLRLGGAASFFASVHTLEELREAFAYARERGLPVYVLGGGSNVLFPDAGWRGLVIRLALGGRAYVEDSKGDAQVIAGAGEVWDALVEETVGHGLWGMENLSGIPGTVGATPIQNVGAYGVEVSELIDWVEALDARTDELHVLSPRECAFTYRDSVFKHSAGRRLIVTRVAYRLSTHRQPKLAYHDLAQQFGDREDVSVREVRDAVCAIRAHKFPNLVEVGTAGSFFKNPIVTKELYHEVCKWLKVEVPQYPVDDGHVKIPAAWLLEKLDWKGKREGAVGCWTEQPLLLVHYGGATANELMTFAHKVAEDVKKRTMIRLEPEVNIVRSSE